MDPSAPPPRPPRLTMRQFWHDVGAEVFSLDRGLPYTLARMLRDPGGTIRHYVEWRDPRITRPLRFFIVCAVVATLLDPGHPFVEGFAKGYNDANDSGPAIDAEWLVRMIEQWRIPLLLSAVPAITVGVGRAFRAHGDTGAELWVFSLYVFAMNWLLLEAIAALIVATGWQQGQWLTLGAPLYFVWTCIGYFGGAIGNTVFKAIGALLLTALALFAIIGLLLLALSLLQPASG